MAFVSQPFPHTPNRPISPSSVPGAPGRPNRPMDSEFDPSSARRLVFPMQATPYQVIDLTESEPAEPTEAETELTKAEAESTEAEAKPTEAEAEPTEAEAEPIKVKKETIEMDRKEMVDLTGSKPTVIITKVEVVVKSNAGSKRANEEENDFETPKKCSKCE